ncbi:MAG: hypothetical protein GY898_05215 [Proteobacteria bacterium]|nr:hypothetical protein [Pseudomonadota bacterium]
MTDSAAAALAHLEQVGEGRYEVLPCDPELADTAVFCAHYGFEEAHSANAVVVKSKRGEPEFGVVMVLATCKVNNRAIRKLLQTSKASFASADETRDRTGMMIGGVTPFGLPEGLPIWIDSRVMALQWTIVGGGSRSVKIKVDPAELPGAVVVEDLASELGS